MNLLAEARRRGADDAVRALITETLESTGGNVSAAARELATSYSGLRRTLRRLGFPPRGRQWARREPGPWTCVNGHELQGDASDTYFAKGPRGYSVCRRCKTAQEQKARKARRERDRSRG